MHGTAHKKRGSVMLTNGEEEVVEGEQDSEEDNGNEKDNDGDHEDDREEKENMK